VVACDDDFVGMGEGVEPVYLGLDLGWGPSLGEVAGVD